MPTPLQVDAAARDLSNIGYLIYQAYRMDSTEQAEVETKLFLRMRKSYEAELTRNSAALGCDRVGRLDDADELQDLKNVSSEYGASITRSFNLDLTKAITAIRDEYPRANRNYYAVRLDAWEDARSNWKDKQVGMIVTEYAAQAAREDFLRNNPVTGKAYFEPEEAAEIDCQTLVKDNPHPLEDVEMYPVPRHPNCPHIWRLQYDRLPIGGCDDLWMG